MIYKLVSSWGPKKFSTTLKITVISILVGTFGPHNVGNTRYTHTHTHTQILFFELSNIKRPGRPWRTTVMDDRRILYMVKKNPFATSSQVNNTLQEVGMSLSTSTIKRRLHKSKYRGLTTRCKQGQIRLCQKNKSQTTSGKAFFGRLKLRSTCTRMMGRKVEGLEQLMIQSIQHHL